MLFNSAVFFLFLPLTLLLYAVARGKQRNHVLLIASYIFYGFWDWRFLGLIAFSTVLDYLCARGIAQSRTLEPDETRAKHLLYISVFTNLGLLAVFKYLGFFADSLDSVLAALGLPAAAPAVHILLPVGISFYTFQTMSYTIDVYRGRLEPVKSFLDFSLYVSFFPQLVAGPIERAEHFVPQILSRRIVTLDSLKAAVHLCIWGYFKKVFIADSVGIYVERIFSSPDPSGFDVCLGVYAFAVQIYCDFSGYTDIARGVALLFGFDLMLNFNLPYFAKNPQEFWTRWHISLSSWLRDYLYIPLGGNRGGRAKTMRNLMITMLLGGLWHGAAWNFVIWGFYQGTLLVLHRRLSETRWAARLDPYLPPWVRIAVMFQFTAYGWLLFRANSWNQIHSMTAALASPWDGAAWGDFLALAPYVAPLAVVQLVQYSTGRLMFLDFNWGSLEVRAVIYSIMVYVCLFHGAAAQSFIYFQF